MTTAEKSSALGDERGAVMLCGLFFCVLGVSAVYYVWSVAEVIRYRERVQDGADMAAFSGAVVHAHGMNLIALFNMVMAALLAILVALRLVQLLCWFAIGAIISVGWLTGGALYSAIPPLQSVSQTMKNLADRLERPIHKTIEVVHTVGDGVARITPLAAAGRTVALSRRAYKPDVELAASLPIELTLPVESDDFSVLCGHAGKYAGEMAMFPLDPVIPDKISGAVSDALAKLTQAGSGWFCGKKGSKPPSLTQDSTHKTSLPASPARDRCMDTSRDDIPVDGSVDEVCMEATLQELRSLPDHTGACREGRPACPTGCSASTKECPPTGSACRDELDDPEVLRRAGEPVPSCEPLEWRYQAARNQCAPTSAGGPSGLKGLWWLQQEVRRTYQSDGQQFHLVLEEPVGEGEVVMRDEDAGGHPCGDGGRVGEGYATSGPACESRAQCATPHAPGPCKRNARAFAGATFTERVMVVEEIVHCIHERKVPSREREQQAEAVNVRPDDGKDEKLAPFMLEEGLWLGDEELQIRALAWGAGPSEAPFHGVRLAAWGREPDSFLDTAVGAATAVMERIAVAQGEYYYHTSEGPLDMGSHPDLLWKMAWRARMRPFHLGLDSLCSRMGSGPVVRRSWGKRLGKICDSVDEALSSRKPGGKHGPRSGL